MKHIPRSEVDFSLLSTREAAVVNGAVEGFTDEQIARSLGISVGTVNSYWARIRSKIGPLTRTEIATLVLRREMEERCAALEAQIQALKARENALMATDLSRPKAPPGSEAWRFLALSHLVVAAMVIEPSGSVLYANPAARKLFGAVKNELDGLSIWSLVEREDGSDMRPEMEKFVANRQNRNVTGGVDRPFYARRRDGSLQRIVLTAESFDTEEGVMIAVTLRPYSQDAVEFIQSLQNSTGE